MTEPTASSDPFTATAPEAGPGDAGAPSSQPLDADIDAALERERWLRAQFEREHAVNLSVMRILLGNIRDESRLIRFWRWLIDDIRSERREIDELYSTSGRIDRVLQRRSGRG